MKENPSPHPRVLILRSSCRERVLQSKADPVSINLDQVKAEQILSLTHDVLLLINSQTPVIRKLLKSCQWTIVSILIIFYLVFIFFHIFGI